MFVAFGKHYAGMLVCWYAWMIVAFVKVGFTHCYACSVVAFGKQTLGGFYPPLCWYAGMLG
jgi:hypothetical protein